jgi:hypothetical protein
VIAKLEVAARTRLELRLVNGPTTIRVQGTDIKIAEKSDVAVLVLVTVVERTIMSEEIVAVTTDTMQFMRLRAFTKSDGAITLEDRIA